MKTQKSCILFAFLLVFFLFACTRQTRSLPTVSSVKENNYENFVYLFPPQKLTEIFHFDTQTGIAQKLTDTGGMVIDYAINSQNSDIVYSVINEFGGADIWLLNWMQNKASKLVDCNEDICTDVRISPDGKVLSFQQGKYPLESGNYLNNDDIHFFALDKDSSYSNFLNDIFSGINVLWAPDGKYLAYYETEKESIRIIDRDAKEILSIKSSNQSTSFSWGMNSEYFYFVLEDSANEMPVSLLEEVHMVDKSFRRINIALNKDEVINRIKHSPSTQQLAISIRPSTFLPGQKLEIYDLQKEEMFRETQDADISFGNYSWSNNGLKIIYQRYAYNSTAAEPEIGIWDLLKDSHEIYVYNAVMPQFIQ